jgi:hypothetical protein
VSESSEFKEDEEAKASPSEEGNASPSEEGAEPPHAEPASPAPQGGPAPPAAPQPAMETKEIIAPEAVPVAEQAAAQVPHLPDKQQVLPGEGAIPLLPESMAIQWGDETPPATPAARPFHFPLPGAVAEEAGKQEAIAGEAVAPPSVRPAGMAPAPPVQMPAAAPGIAWEAAPARPVSELPVFPSLPPQFRGTLADIGRFIGAGSCLFLLGGLVYFVLAVASFGTAVLDSQHTWTAGRAADDAVGGLLCLVLAAGSCLGFLLSRRKLRGAFRRNDFPALFRRLAPAAAAGLVFGMVLGGVFLFLAYLKVDELPVVHEKPADRLRKGETQKTI